MSGNIGKCIIGALLLNVGTYYILKKETRIDTLKKQGIKKAEDITIEHFMDLISNNPSITLDDAILDFEKAETTNLDEFSKSKSRTKEMYYETYSKFFEQSKINVINEQKTLENQVKN